MVKKIPFSNDYIGLFDIAIHHMDTELSLQDYFLSESKRNEERFLGYSSEELTAELGDRKKELSHTSSLSVLASLEAAFRIDYLQRNYQKKKDPL